MTTFNQTTFEDNVRAYVAQGSGLAAKWVIPAEEMGPVPDESFASVRIINDVQVGYAMDIETEAVDGSVILYQRIYKNASLLRPVLPQGSEGASAPLRCVDSIAVLARVRGAVLLLSAAAVRCPQPQRDNH